MSKLRYVFFACLVALLIGRMVDGREAVEIYLGNRLFDVGIVFSTIRNKDETVSVWAMAVGITVVDYFTGWPRFWTINIDTK